MGSRPKTAGHEREVVQDQPSQERRGQAMAEFAIVAPVLFLVIAGTIQFGLIFWSQQTLTQIARDTGRWAATQSSCEGSSAQVTQVANAIAGQSTLFGYSTDQWANGGTDPTNKVVVSWPRDTGQPCPPASNQEEAWVRVEIDHQVPIFFPFVPGDGRLTTTAEFRMEPEPV